MGRDQRKRSFGRTQFLSEIIKNTIEPKDAEEEVDEQIIAARIILVANSNKSESLFRRSHSRAFQAHRSQPCSMPRMESESHCFLTGAPSRSIRSEGVYQSAVSDTLNASLCVWSVTCGPRRRCQPACRRCKNSWATNYVSLLHMEIFEASLGMFVANQTKAEVVDFIFKKCHDNLMAY